MKRTVFLAAMLVLAMLPAVALAHPPGNDPHNSCLQPYPHQGWWTPPVRVKDTLSYLAPVGTSPNLPCVAPPDTAEWGSHSPGCPAPPFVGPIPGAYCGPLVAPGGTATCSWRPVFNTVPTELVIGFDGRPAGPNGFVNLVVDGERPVWGSYPPGAWQVPNPLGVKARVIAFPTNVAMPPDPLYGVLAPGDLNDVICVTP